MPLYEYRCSECLSVVEIFRTPSQRYEPASCTKCGHAPLDLLLSSFGIAARTPTYHSKTSSPPSFGGPVTPQDDDARN